MTDGLLLSDVTIAIGGRVLIDRLDLHVAPGEVLSLMGASGSGKSTLIAYLCGAIDPAFAASGRVVLNGVRIDALPTETRRVGVLFQDDLLFTHMSVGENLAFALPRGQSRATRRERVEEALAEAELEGFAGRSPATLSGGQKARVSLMRAILAEPLALFLDEPFAKLDPSLRARIREFTFGIIAKRRIPALLVTHDVQDAPATVLRLAG